MDDDTHVDRLVSAGLALLPNDNETKYPHVANWQHKTFSAAALRAHLQHGGALGLRTGNGVEAIDVDSKHWRGEGDLVWLFEQLIDPALLARLVIQKTRSGGRHYIYRCTTAEGNRKLAERQPQAGEREKQVTLIETRGQGGQIMIAPSDGYEVLQGDLAAIPEIRPGERAALFSAARAFHQIVQASKIDRRESSLSERPGDLYNRNGGQDDALRILEASGWRVVFARGEAVYLRRPGKNDGVSATYNYVAPGVFYCFTSNGHPFEPNQSYSPFAIKALLEHNGDYADAARAIAKQYAPPIQKPQERRGVVVPRSEAPDAREVAQIVYPIPISAETLAKKDIIPTRYFIDSMLRAGLALFIGNPGIGKTPALLQLALAFATGGKWLGSIPCPPCRVLYIGVEYEEAYIREVITDSYGSTEHPADLHILSMETFTSPRTAEESIAMLEHYLTVYRYDVILVDTFSGFLPSEKFKQNIYRGDYAEFLAYHRLLTLYRAVLIGSWHGGKHAKDPETAYNGGQGMWGSAGGGRLTMMRSDDDQQVRLRSQLRGHERMEWVITQARVGAAHYWSLVDAEPDPILGSDAQRRIYMAIKDHSTPIEPLTPQGVRAILSADAPELGIKENYIRQILLRLSERGILERWNGGYIVKKRVTGVTPVTRVTPVTGVTGVTPVTESNTDARVTDVTGALQVPLQQESHSDAVNSERYSRYSVTGVTALFTSVPLDKRESLLTFLRSPEPAMQTRARLTCEEYGVDYQAALNTVRSIR